MADENIPDWLTPDDDDELTEQQVIEAWRKLARMDLTGKMINLGCGGGDGYEIDAKIEQVVPVLGVGVVLRINSATIVRQQDLGDPNKWPEELPEARYVLLDVFKWPPKFKDERDVIVLYGGGECFDQTGEVSFGGCLCVGFIFLER